ncbi:MAG TPA: hypothetical protein VK789_10050 [Bryobacteraceae bacterium]|nr:hypothetical protein [Bryobacteraceae bacterium]
MSLRTCSIGLASLLVLAGWASLAENPETFTLAEQFGASWPDQPIEFRYDGGKPPANTRMIGPNGTEVPFQWVSSCSDATATKGCILVRSNLPGNANYTWTLQPGAMPTASVPNPVRLTQNGADYELTNGLTGVRMVSAEGNPRPWNRAPIQGILLPGGVWTGAGSSPNLLYSEKESASGCIGCVLMTPMYTATGYRVTVVDSGPMKVVLKATYNFNRPRYIVGNMPINAAGAGHYAITLTLYSGSKSVLIDEDSDMMFSYYLPLYAQIQPDQIRWRGHDSNDGSGFASPICGYESPSPVRGATATSPIVITAANKMVNGQHVLIADVQGIAQANGTYFAKTAGYPAGQFGLYFDSVLKKPVAGAGTYAGGGILKPGYLGSGWKASRPDAYQDITYTSDRPALYICGVNTYRKLASDFTPAAAGAGFYLMTYRSTAGQGGPVVGMYSGRASQMVFSAISMPGLYSSDRHWVTGERAAGIQVDNLLRGPSGVTAQLVHRNWALWTSTQRDLLPPSAHQPIGTDQSSLTGINLSHLYGYHLIYPDPPGGWNWLYLSPQGATALVGAVRNGTPVCGSVDCYYTLLFNSEGSPWGRSLLKMWKAGTTAAVQEALDNALGLARYLSRILAEGDNHFTAVMGSYELGLSAVPQTAVLNAIMMDPNATAAQKKAAKAALALFGSIFWDNDWFPVDNNSGEGGGLSNQVQQFLEYRLESVAAAPSQPFLASRMKDALGYAVNDFKTYFSPTGAIPASTHYAGAFFQPLILNYMSFSQRGELSMNDPKWAALAQWELSIQTPPEPRFGNLRKGYSNGDGNTEADVRTGMLGTALKAVNPELAGNLMWAWRQSNSPTMLTEDAQFVTTIPTIDASIPSVEPHLGSINIPGYHTSERFGFGTPDETAVWFINGGFYSSGGHRHFDDGQVTIYADGAPLAIDWNANLYNPSTAGRFMHDSIVYDGEQPHAWDSDNPGLEGPSVLMKNPTNAEFAMFSASTTSTANFTAADDTVWTRSVRTMVFHRGYPIIYVKDTFTGPGSKKGKTLTWNMMASGAVGTPTGPVTPVTRFSPGCQQPPPQLPSNGGVFGLSPGLDRFTFTGQTWPKHHAQGIDWDLYALPAGSTSRFFIGNWGHGCHGTREMSEYQAANGSPFVETQHILRIHDTEPFTTILLPYNKNGRPVRTVTQQACGIQIVQELGQNGRETTCFNDSSAQYSNGTKSVLTVYDGAAQSAFGVRASGGPQEIAIEAGKITWTISGSESGQRIVALPGSWSPSQPLTQSGGAFTYTFSGGLQTTPVTVVFTQR